MSYQPKEWAEQAMRERWARLVDDRSGRDAPEWVPNNRPREIAREYIQVSQWAILLEQELERTTALLDGLGVRLTGATDGIDQQIKKSREALRARPSNPETPAALVASDA
jgi:hypothetical protein